MLGKRNKLMTRAVVKKRKRASHLAGEHEFNDEEDDGGENDDDPSTGVHRPCGWPEHAWRRTNSTRSSTVRCSTARCDTFIFINLFPNTLTRGR